MKICVEIDPANGEEEEVVIRCNTLSEEVMMLQKQLSEIISSKLKLEVYKGDTVLYLSPDEILFLETADNFLAVHTAKEIYSAKQRLYELEEMLPSSFVYSYTPIYFFVNLFSPATTENVSTVTPST